MNGNILDLMDKMKTLDGIQEAHFSLAEKIGVKKIPEELPVRGELGDCYTVRHSHVKGMDTYTLNAFEKSVVIAIFACDPTIEMTVWDKEQKKCTASMRIHLGCPDGFYWEMLKYNGSVTAGSTSLYLIRNAIRSFLEGMP